MKLIDGIPVWGDPVDEGALRQIKNCQREAVHVALMADHHLGYAVPIGGVVAYDEKVSPSGVGYDIGCGNKAVLTDAYYHDIEDRIDTIMDDIVKTISFGMGRVNEEKVNHPVLAEIEESPVGIVRGLSGLARNQLGTVGAGNHYVDIFQDEKWRIWVGVHFGSRGFGHKIASHYLRGVSDDFYADPLVLDIYSEPGNEYLDAMSIAGRYAYAGRDWVCARVCKILGADVIDEVHNHHNYSWTETHHGQELIVVRKGATPAFPGQRGFVGGSMGDMSVILEGVASDPEDERGIESREALWSTIHGAGRAMSRTRAKGKMRRKKINGIWVEELVRPGEISRDDMDDWISKMGVTLRGGDLDEAPQAYKRLPEVLKHHDGTVRVLHVLEPLGVAMAGPDIYDPFKD